MRERGILFSAPMVCALLAGTKTQTRRIMKDAPGGHPNDDGYWGTILRRCRYGVVGDRLWVRETWRAFEDPDSGYDYIRFRADDRCVLIPETKAAGDFVVGKFDRWHPAIHMPRWASRITLEVSDVRVQRLHDITEEDARAEGIIEWVSDDGARKHYGLSDADVWETTARGAYRRLWGDINGANSWGRNPFVWAISFRRVQT